MNHLRDRVPHSADGLCQYAHQYNNKVLICKVRLTLSASIALVGPSSKCDVVNVCCSAFLNAVFCSLNRLLIILYMLSSKKITHYTFFSSILKIISCVLCLMSSAVL